MGVARRIASAVHCMGFRVPGHVQSWLLVFLAGSTKVRVWLWKDGKLGATIWGFDVFAQLQLGTHCVRAHASDIALGSRSGVGVWVRGDGA